MFARVVLACSVALIVSAQVCTTNSNCGAGFECARSPPSALEGTCQPLPPLSLDDSCVGRVYDCPVNSVCYPGANSTMTCTAASGTLCVIDSMCFVAGEVCYRVYTTDFLGVCVLPPQDN